MHLVFVVNSDLTIVCWQRLAARQYFFFFFFIQNEIVGFSSKGVSPPWWPDRRREGGEDGGWGLPLLYIRGREVCRSFSMEGDMGLASGSGVEGGADYILNYLDKQWGWRGEKIRLG